MDGRDGGIGELGDVGEEGPAGIIALILKRKNYVLFHVTCVPISDLTRIAG